MKPRLDLTQVSSGALNAMLGLEAFVAQSHIERPLFELVRMRASQINGCAHCLDMHSKDARSIGETEQRLYVLPGWREAPFYDERERAALEWTEAVTRSAEDAEDLVLANVEEYVAMRRRGREDYRKGRTRRLAELG